MHGWLSIFLFVTIMSKGDSVTPHTDVAISQMLRRSQVEQGGACFRVVRYLMETKASKKNRVPRNFAS
jgi:hypothetical protein